MISDRIEKIMLYLGDNKTSFSKRLGISNNVTIGRIIKENRNPSFEILSKIAEAVPLLNCNWLLRGKGEMINGKDNVDISNIQDFLAFARDNNDELLKNSDYKLLLTKNIALLELEKQKKGLQEEEEELRKMIKDLPISKKT